MLVEVTPRVLEAIRRYNENTPPLSEIGKLNAVAWLGEWLAHVAFCESKPGIAEGAIQRIINTLDRHGGVRFDERSDLMRETIAREILAVVVGATS